ncbi:hypothetical protein F4777DRAFT_575801 [Nemania sp. FL0916]|nr:hypothetical protein F4777DRAFT_575801 [Nemania sp. FL0916]
MDDNIKSPRVADYYGDLEVPQTANTKEIRKAYQTRALATHPDKQQNKSVDADEFRRVQKAYEVLSDLKQRANYDKNYSWIQEVWSDYRQKKQAQREREELRAAEERAQREREEQRAAEERAQRELEEQRAAEEQALWEQFAAQVRAQREQRAAEVRAQREQRAAEVRAQREWWAAHAERNRKRKREEQERESEERARHEKRKEADDRMHEAARRNREARERTEQEKKRREKIAEAEKRSEQAAARSRAYMAKTARDRVTNASPLCGHRQPFRWPKRKGPASCIFCGGGRHKWACLCVECGATACPECIDQFH